MQKMLKCMFKRKLLEFNTAIEFNSKKMEEIFISNALIMCPKFGIRGNDSKNKSLMTIVKCLLTALYRLIKSMICARDNISSCLEAYMKYSSS